MSAISITPAFNVWMPSPDSGTSTSTVDSAVRAAGGHGPDEHPRVEAGRLHPDAVAQQRPAGEGTGGIDRDDAHPELPGAEPLDQPLGERALARAGRSRDADAPRRAPAQAGMHVRQQALEPIALVLDEADRAGQRRRLPSLQPLDDAFDAHARFMQS